ncbi:uncharacterized protein LOC129907824 isoform X3 [Episyrphus balteatus]|uniref:uncharacterized protein LOC129907824 isoform X3 n=1 Tax=Episyrphus balteatus TaxID=286459 RepID=UPI002484EC72|nr:uncharacterized protein LOC129907824 isoform X3 [Episyrphus balteatus]
MAVGKQCCTQSRSNLDFKLFTMSSVPQAAFAVRKLRNLNEKEMTVAKLRMKSEMPDMRNNLANKKLIEYSPVKYNSKLMNSIWGLYNRYSPHNIKGNEYEVENEVFNKQQRLAVASYTIEKNLSMAGKTGDEWNFP